MKVSKAILPTTTRFKLQDESGGPLLDENGNEDNVYITAYTPDSKEWRQSLRKYGMGGKRTMRVGKKGSEVDLPDDPLAFEKRTKRLASIVIDIEGLEDWEFSPANVLELFSNDGCAWIVDQLEDHMEDRSNFLKSPAKPVSDGSKSKAG